MNINAPQDLVLWLSQHNVSLAVSTYRANRLIFLGRDEADELQINECAFDRPMGLQVQDNSLWLVSRYQLWRFDNLLEAGQRHEGADRLYVPTLGHTTGDVNGHELVIQADGTPLFVNTAFSCLATVQPGYSFAPVWQPPFISQLAAEDRCHLNGLTLVDGQPTWATACGPSDTATGWRDHRAGGGVVLHIPSNRIVATGLSMPHSPRLHGGKLWLLNSGTGELGWIDGERFVPLCFVPGFARGLAFVGNTAVVGLSKLRSPQFSGLALDDRLQAGGVPGGCCGLRVIDLASGAILHSLDLPDPVDELFDVVVLPGVRQARAFGLQGEDIHCLVRLPGRAQLVTVRPKAPSGNPYQGVMPALFGMPGPAAAAVVSTPARAAAPEAVRYQRVFQLTAQTLAPYASLTFPSLASGSRRLASLPDELLAVSAMAGGTMVGLVIAGRSAQVPDQATVCSLMVAPAWRRQGIGARLLGHLQHFIAGQGVQALALRYHTSAVMPSPIEPLLARLGWPAPRTDFVLIQGSAERLASADWHTRFPIAAPYTLFAWVDATPSDLAAVPGLGAPPELWPPSPGTAGAKDLEPAVSLGLRCHGALVGWLIAHRVDAHTVRYSSVYVAPAHRGRARALALAAEGFACQHGAGIGRAKAAVQVGNAVAWPTFERRVQAYFPVVAQARSARVQFQDAVTAVTAMPP